MVMTRDIEKKAADKYAAASTGYISDYIHVGLFQAFLAGAAYSRKAIRIDPKDESTWPKGEHLAYLTYPNTEKLDPNWEHYTARLSDNHYDVSMSKVKITHWAPLPTLPEEGD